MNKYQITLNDLVGTPEKAKDGPCFHGESYSLCPHCNEMFEFFDFVYKKMGLKKVAKNIYKCSKCGGLMYKRIEVNENA